jgi:trimeric autotransporter adhesin
MIITITLLQLTVMSEAGTFCIPLRAQRPPPLLNLPADGVIDCGGCLLGQAHTCKFTLTNSGGAVRLRLLPEEAYPKPTVAQRLLPRLQLGAAFTVFPTQYTLVPGAVSNSTTTSSSSSAVVTVEFVPRAVGVQTVRAVLLQDNCEARILTFTARCEQAAVAVVTLDDGKALLDTTATTANDADATTAAVAAAVIKPLQVHLPLAVAGASVSRTLWVRNSTSLPLSLCWQLRPLNSSNSNSPTKPGSKAAVAATAAAAAAVAATALFTVDSTQTVVPAHTSVPVRVTFAPPSAGTACAQLVAVLQGAPREALAYTTDTAGTTATTVSNGALPQLLPELASEPGGVRFDCVLRSAGAAFSGSALAAQFERWLQYTSESTEPEAVAACCMDEGGADSEGLIVQALHRLRKHDTDTQGEDLLDAAAATALLGPAFRTALARHLACVPLEQLLTPLRSTDADALCVELLAAADPTVLLVTPPALLLPGAVPYGVQQQCYIELRNGCTATVASSGAASSASVPFWFDAAAAVFTAGSSGCDALCSSNSASAASSAAASTAAATAASAALTSRTARRSTSSSSAAAGAPATAAAQPLAELTVEPSSGQLAPGESLLVCITITSYTTGAVTASIPLHAPSTLPATGSNSSATVHSNITVQLQCSAAQLRLGSAEVDLGLIAVGGSAERSVTLTNESAVPVLFDMSTKDDDTALVTAAVTAALTGGTDSGRRPSTASSLPTPRGRSRSVASSATSADSFWIENAAARVACAPCRSVLLEAGATVAVNVSVQVSVCASAYVVIQFASTHVPNSINRHFQVLFTLAH